MAPRSADTRSIAYSKSVACVFALAIVGSVWLYLGNMKMCPQQAKSTSISMSSAPELGRGRVVCIAGCQPGQLGQSGNHPFARIQKGPHNERSLDLGDWFSAKLRMADGEAHGPQKACTCRKACHSLESRVCTRSAWVWQLQSIKFIMSEDM